MPRPSRNPVERYIADLEQVGWFAMYAPDQRERVLAHLRDPERQGAKPQSALPGTWFDAECVYDETCHKELVEQVAEDSFGLFRPDSVTETWADGAITLTIRCDGRDVTGTWQYESDYLDDAFYAVLAEAVGTAPGCGLYAVDTGGQDGTLFVAHDDVVAAAKKKRLLTRVSRVTPRKQAKATRTSSRPDGADAFRAMERRGYLEGLPDEYSETLERRLREAAAHDHDPRRALMAVAEVTDAEQAPLAPTVAEIGAWIAAALRLAGRPAPVTVAWDGDTLRATAAGREAACATRDRSCRPYAEFCIRNGTLSRALYGAAELATRLLDGAPGVCVIHCEPHHGLALDPVRDGDLALLSLRNVDSALPIRWRSFAAWDFIYDHGDDRSWSKEDAERTG